MIQRTALGSAAVAVGAAALIASCASRPADLESRAAPALASVNAPAGETEVLPTLSEAKVAEGKRLYEANCMPCHGVEGEGESPGEPAAVDSDGRYVAPALNGSMHAWHHTDVGLISTILQGSPRNPRMRSWADAGLSEDDAVAIVEYLKSLWGPMQRRCQGPGHMDLNCVRSAGSNSN